MSATESPKEWLGQVEFVAKNIQNFWTIGAAVAGVFVGVMFGLDFLIWTLNFNLDGATFWSVYFRGNPEGLWGYEIMVGLAEALILGVWLFVYVGLLFGQVVSNQISARLQAHGVVLWFYGVAMFIVAINSCSLILVLMALLSFVVIPLLSRGFAWLSEKNIS